MAVGKSTILNIAHRGASAHFPENTLGAFAAAIDTAADMCELDVQLTMDGALVVIHDETVDRTTDGRGRVDAMTLAELKRLDAGSWRAARFASERIPTLAEVFDLTEGGCGLNIELKATGVGEMVGRLIRERKAQASTLVSSFDWAELVQVQNVAPEIRVGLLTDRAAARVIDAAMQMKAFAINPAAKLVSLQLCARAHQQGLKVYTWTVDDPDDMRRLVEMGVDGIMTNDPEHLRTVLDS